MDKNQKYTIIVTEEEHIMITGLLMMHYTGLIVNVHPTHRPTLSKLAQRISLENIRIMTNKLI